MGPASFTRTQAFLGYAVLTLSLLSVLVIGGNSPLVWSLLSIMLLPLFAVQAVLAFAAPVPIAIRRLALSGGLFLLVIIWAWLQSLVGVGPPLAHPYWANLPDVPAAISADPAQTRQGVVRLLSYAMIFVVTVWAAGEARRAVRILKIAALFAFALAAYGIYAWAIGANLLVPGDAGTVVTASFVNRNSYATYAAFGALANLAAYLHVSGQQVDTLKGRLEGFFSGAWVFAFGFLVSVGALSLTQSRAGALAGALGLVVFLLAWRRDRARTWDLVMLGLMIAMLFFVGLTSATGLAERFLATGTEELRFAAYPAILGAIADRPLVGHGRGAFHDGFRPYVPIELAEFEWRRAHNTFLEIAFGLGVPMAFVFFATIGIVVARIYRGAKSRRANRALPCFALASVATAALHSMFDFSLQMPGAAALFAVILGLGYAQSFTRAEKAEHGARRGG